MAKRIFDLAAACLGLIVLAPLLVLIGCLIKLGSNGPVLYRQERMGRSFRPFKLLKFRSMVVGAEGLGPSITAAGDCRVTRIGHWLRRTKVDELPQLINVVRGEMSLVGPRPEVRRYVERFRSDYEAILSVRPGITDYAAIEFRNEEELLAGFQDPEAAYVEYVMPKKIELYRKYLAERGFRVDFAIIVKTLARIVPS